MISIIIPTYNEEAVIGRLLTCLNEHSHGFIKEIIISDGGSSDQTREIAEQLGASVVLCSVKKRSTQLNTGAEAATGEVLYFLHADTFPPRGFDRMIMNATQAGYYSGCFRLKFNSRHPLMKFYAWFTRFRPAFIRFGDQSLFVNRKVFSEIEGYREELIVMEDQEIVKRLRRVSAFKIIPEQVRTSARKYEQFGYLRLQLIFAIIVAGYYCGIDQKTLFHFYKTSLKN